MSLIFDVFKVNIMESKFIIIDKADLEIWKIEILNELRKILEDGSAVKSDPMWLTETCAQEYIGVKRTTMYKHRRDGVIPFTQRGRKILYRRSDLNQFLHQNITIRNTK